MSLSVALCWKVSTSKTSQEAGGWDGLGLETLFKELQVII